MNVETSLTDQACKRCGKATLAVPHAPSGRGENKAERVNLMLSRPQKKSWVWYFFHCNQLRSPRIKKAPRCSNVEQNVRPPHRFRWEQLLSVLPTLAWRLEITRAVEEEM